MGRGKTVGGDDFAVRQIYLEDYGPGLQWSIFILAGRRYCDVADPNVSVVIFIGAEVDWDCAGVAPAQGEALQYRLFDATRCNDGDSDRWWYLAVLR
jgi:hypothetical protein